MFLKTRLSASLMLAFGGALASSAFAQQALERVEITGSSIRRVDAEGALPVTVLQRADIEKTGATSVTDLLQKMPGLQGGTTESGSVGGDGKGFAGASIHNLTENRTLVLLNGRRLANYGGQNLQGTLAAFDLNSLPLAAIERVEVLTDGASALYGADAIAGVVNFITRRNMSTGDLSLGASRPKGAVAREERFSLSKGIGDLETDGFNVMASFAVDRRSPMNGTDRSFSKTGVIDFENGGKRYQAFLGSVRGAPANATDDADDLVNPHYFRTGACASSNIKVTDPSTNKTSCYYDFASKLETYSERKRNSFFTTATVKVAPDHTVFADLLLSRNTSSAKIAAVPVEIGIAAGSALHDQYLAPMGITGDSVAYWRAADLGGRTDENISDFGNVVIGANGLLSGWDYKGAVTHSESRFKQNISGYPGGLALNRLRDSGAINPFLDVGQQDAAGVAALSAVAYKGLWDAGDSKLTSVDLSGSRELFQLTGGPLSLGTGASFYQERFAGKPSLFAQGKLADPVAGTECTPGLQYPDPGACDQRAGDAAAIVPYSAKRNAYGLFLELNAPLVKSFELNGAVRYDHYDDFGSTTNGKTSFRWTPVQGLLFRGSVGTGFKAPTVPQVKATAQPYGVTSTQYESTAALEAIATSLGAQTRPGEVQYDKTAGGNANLKPEKSRQATIGMVFEPVPSVSLGADLWHVAVRDVIGQISEGSAFADPAKYANSWAVQRDIATGIDYIAFKADNQNLGKLYSTGIDFNVQGRTSTPLGRLTTQLLATYMLREKKQQASGGEYFSAVGQYDPSLTTVTFRWQGRATASLKTGNWTNTLQANFKSGYKDAVAEVQIVNADGTLSGEYEDVQLKIKRYVTFDFQSQFQATKNFSITAGLLNVFDRDPPLSLADGGLGKGQMFGYDDRYYDARGRTLYVNGNFTF